MRFSTEEIFFKSPQEMETLFSAHPEAIKNTIEIAERCNLRMNLEEDHLPDFPTPKGETLDSMLEIRANEGLDNRLEILGEQGASMLKKRSGNISIGLKKRYRSSSAWVSGLLPYRHRLYRLRKRAGHPRRPGQGKRRGSLVAYSLGITNLDPIEHNLLFERF